MRTTAHLELTVMVAPGEVLPAVAPVPEAGVASPWHTVGGRKGARALGFIEEE
jgi:hypothetical protein